VKNSPESRHERTLGVLLGLALAGREGTGPVGVMAQSSWPDVGRAVAAGLHSGEAIRLS